MQMNKTHTHTTNTDKEITKVDHKSKPNIYLIDPHSNTYFKIHGIFIMAKTQTERKRLLSTMRWLQIKNASGMVYDANKDVRSRLGFAVMMTMIVRWNRK